MMKRWPGREITKEDMINRKIITILYKTEFKYAWTCGVAMSRFLEGLRYGKIMGRTCKKCGRILVPPRMFCEKCFRNTDEWIELKDTGRIITYSVCYVAFDASRLSKPMAIGVIEIDGASNGMGLLHIIKKVEPTRIKIGMKVKAKWKNDKFRSGSITDIDYFKPTGD